jgi:hypothetical protein
MNSHIDQAIGYRAAMNQGALYYPYMHIENVDWLKATLLVFDSVSRMLPPEYEWGLNDDFRVMDFQKTGLLTRANLFSERSFAAQDVLARKLRASAEDRDFLRRFGQHETEELLTRHNPYGFQIHRDKSTFPPTRSVARGRSRLGAKDIRTLRRRTRLCAAAPKGRSGRDGDNRHRLSTVRRP